MNHKNLGQATPDLVKWNDFVLDEEFGPTLDTSDLDCRRMRLGRPSIRKDAQANLIQETGQEQRPARMVGSSGSEYQNAPSDMEVRRNVRVLHLRRREDG